MFHPAALNAIDTDWPITEVIKLQPTANDTTGGIELFSCLDAALRANKTPAESLAEAESTTRESREDTPPPLVVLLHLLRMLPCSCASKRSFESSSASSHRPFLSHHPAALATPKSLLLLNDPFPLHILMSQYHHHRSQMTAAPKFQNLKRPCGCDTFVAFPPATTSPNLIVFGKNSDRPTGEGQNIRRYRRATYQKDANGIMPKVQCTYIAIDQVQTTHAVLLSQIDWMFGAEMGANEHDVVIGNEAIWTRDDCSSEPNFLLGMDLVRLGLERGNTARHALKVITSLLETHGQGGGCAEDDPSFTYHNSYLIVDPIEAWVLETSGRHWVAERVTEGVRNISNCLSIRSNFDLCSKGIEEYAIKNGYWKESDGSFDFAEAFSTCGSADSEMSDPRFCGGKRLLEKHVATGKMDKDAMISILRDHPSGICMHGGGFETTSAWVSELCVKNGKVSKAPARHYVTGGPHPCKSNFKEEKIS